MGVFLFQAEFFGQEVRVDVPSRDFFPGYPLDDSGRAQDVAGVVLLEDDFGLREQVYSRDLVEFELDDGVAVAGRQDLVLYLHQGFGFGLGFLVLREVDVHFVAVEVGVVGRAVAYVEAECLAG